MYEYSRVVASSFNSHERSRVQSIGYTGKAPEPRLPHPGPPPDSERANSQPSHGSRICHMPRCPCGLSLPISLTAKNLRRMNILMKLTKTFSRRLKIAESAHS